MSSAISKPPGFETQSTSALNHEPPLKKPKTNAQSIKTPTGISVRVSDFHPKPPPFKKRVISFPGIRASANTDAANTVTRKNPVVQSPRIIRKVPAAAAEVTVTTDFVPALPWWSKKRRGDKRHRSRRRPTISLIHENPKPNTGDYSKIDTLLQTYISKEVPNRSMITLIALQLKAEEIARFHSVTLFPDFDDWLDEWRLVHNVALDEDDDGSHDSNHNRLIEALESGNVDFLDTVSDTSDSGSESDIPLPVVGCSGQQEDEEITTQAHEDHQFTVTAPTLRETVDAISVVRRYLESKKEMKGLELLKVLEDNVCRVA